MMHRYLKTTICLLFIGLSIKSTAQDNQGVFGLDDPDVPEVVPPSPTAAALGQYGEIPVDLYHGLPNISVPLYEIVVDDVKVPINLSFHASGHKVGTIASWVGLGWSLNAGGVVTRSMRGRPDEDDLYGYFNNMAEIQSWEDNDLLQYLLPPHQPVSVSMKNYMQLLNDNNWDTQADVFLYNFPGGTGKFMFKPDRSIIQFPYQDVNISRAQTGSYENGFQIKTPDGMVATFNQAEWNQIDYEHNNSEPERIYNSAWYLGSYSSSISNKGVHFTYDEGVLLPGDNIPTDRVFEKLVQFFSHYDSDHASVVNYTSNYTRHLDSIQWELGGIKFYSSATRGDKIGAKKLDSLAIFNAFGEREKSFHFEYLSFISGARELDQYLILRSVTEVGKKGGTNPPHVFEYYDLLNLPPRDSKSVDHYGFFNEKNNTKLTPPLRNIAFGAPIAGGDRSVGLNKAQVGMLRKLHYPTGGYSEFFFESNEYYSESPGNSANTEVAGTVAMAESCLAEGQLYYQDDGSVVIGLICQEVAESLPITIRDDAFDIELILSYESDPTTSISHDGSNDIFVVQIFEIDGATETLINSYTGLLNDQTITGSLSVGSTYKLKAHTNNPGTRLKAEIKYKFIDVPPGGNINNYIGPGIRIARIDHYDESGIARSKVYEYKLKEDPTRSSGSLFARHPEYSTEKNALELYTPPGLTVDPAPVITVVKYRTTVAHPSGVLGALESDLLAYSEVVEREVGNGYTRYFYSNDLDTDYNGIEPFSAGSDHYAPSNLFEKQRTTGYWKRGNVERVEVVSETGELKTQTENFYSHIETDSAKTFHYQLALDRSGGDFYTYDNGYHHAFEEQVTGWSRLDSTHQKVFEDGIESVSKTIYQYENSTPVQLIAPKVTQSILDGVNDIQVETDYLNDRVNHVILPPLETRLYSASGELLKKINYHYISHRPSVINTHFGDSEDPDYTIQLSEYNGTRPSYVQDNSGVDIVYLWGYENTLPVAKITNISYSEIENILGTTKVDIENSNDIAFIRTQLSSLRDSLSITQSMVTYLYEIEGLLIEVVDENGQSTHYNYDEFDRLLSIQDFEGNYLQYFEYNLGLSDFKSANTDTGGSGGSSGSSGSNIDEDNPNLPQEEGSGN